FRYSRKLCSLSCNLFVAISCSSSSKDFPESPPAGLPPELPPFCGGYCGQAADRSLPITDRLTRRRITHPLFDIARGAYWLAFNSTPTPFVCRPMFPPNSDDARTSQLACEPV